jgi:putative membrane protein insertion efficiency factor
MMRAAVILVRAYQLLISPLLPPACRFYPSCSEYAREAVEKWGIVRGLGLTARRLARCHPWGGHGVDPVPENQELGFRGQGSANTTTASFAGKGQL